MAPLTRALSRDDRDGPGVEAALHSVMGLSTGPGEPPDRPPAWMAPYAAAVPGGWVLESDDPSRQAGNASASDVRGAWQVGPDGEFTGDFEPNPHYRPPGVDHAPPDGPSGVLLLFPEAARGDVAYAVQKLGSPSLVRGVLFGDVLTEAVYRELSRVVACLIMGSCDDNWDPTPEMLWFEAIIDFMGDHLRQHIVAEPE